LEEGQAEQALAALDKVTIPETADPREPAMLLFLQARCHRLLGNVAKAEVYERQYRAMDSDIQQLRSALDQASAAGQKPEMHRKSGLICVRLGSFSEAVQWLSAVLQANPNDKIAHQALAECYSRRNDPESHERAEYHRQQAQK